MKRLDLVVIFLGDDLAIYPLNVDLLYLILEIAGLAQYGRHMSCFSIYFSPRNKWQDTSKRKDEEKGR